MKKWLAEDWEFEITVIKGQAKACRMGLEAGDRFVCQYECPAGFCPKTMPVLHTLCEIMRCGGDYRLRGRADTLAVQALTDEIEALRATLKLACTLRQFESAQELEDRIPTIAARAAEDFCTQANPRAVSKEDALEILRAAFGKAE